MTTGFPPGLTGPGRASGAAPGSGTCLRCDPGWTDIDDEAVALVDDVAVAEELEEEVERVESCPGPNPRSRH